MNTKGFLLTYPLGSTDVTTSEDFQNFLTEMKLSLINRGIILPEDVSVDNLVQLVTTELSSLPIKTICATYKIHYKVYRNTTVYNEETVNINDGTNSFTIQSSNTPQTSYLDIEFFDINDKKFIPNNFEFYTTLKANTGGNGMLTMLPNGSVRAVITNSYQDNAPHAHSINFEFDNTIEDIDSRQITITFDIS